MTESSLGARTPSRWNMFVASIFFVLGFSLVFSLVGVLLQTVLSQVAYGAQEWLGRIGGIIIILFGLFTMGLFTPAFLMRDHKMSVRLDLGSRHLTAFLFGAAFAVGWTPCVSAALGAILALAATTPGSAFFLLMAYTLGLGIPFLVVGLFADRATQAIERAGPWLIWVERVFGLFLVFLGILIFVGELNRIANFELLSGFLTELNLVSGAGGQIQSLNIGNFLIALLAGLGSFLSPCVLPLVPGFLSYLASSSIHQKETHEETTA